jgi:hypothetical protein
MVGSAVGSTDTGKTHRRSANPFFTFATSTVFTTASREHEYCADTVHDGTADYH